MSIRTTIDIPEPLHDMLSKRAKMSSTSIRALIIRAIEDAYAPPRAGDMISEPFLHVGKIAPEFQMDENPYDLIFS